MRTTNPLRRPLTLRLAAVVLATLVLASILIVADRPPRAAAAGERDGATLLSSGVPGAMSPAIAADGSTLHAVWADPAFQMSGRRAISYRRSLDGGATWEPARTIGNHSDMHTQDQPAIAVDGDVVAIAWLEEAPPGDPWHRKPDVWVTVSRNGGTSFDPPKQLEDIYKFSDTPRVAVSGDRIWVAFGTHGAGGHLATSTDAGRTFDLRHMTEDKGSGSLDAQSLAVHGATVAYAWRGGRGDGDGYGMYVRTSHDHGETWGPVIEIEDPDGTRPHVLGVAVDTFGGVHATWLSTTKRVFVASSLDGQSEFDDLRLLTQDGLQPQILSAGDDVYVGYWDTVRKTGVVAIGGSSHSGWRERTLDGGIGAMAVVEGADRREPQARVTWDTQPRFGFDGNGDGMVDYSTSDVYVHPLELPVTFDACDSRPGSDQLGEALTFRWTIDGIDRGDACRVTHAFPGEGTYEVTVEVTTESGASTTWSQQVPVEDHLIVSIGDSVASGEGNPDIPGGPLPWHPDARWQEPQCNRSAKGGPAVAAKRIEDRDPRSTVTFLHLACSGATVMDDDPAHGGLLSPYVGIDPSQGPVLPPQLDQLEALVGDREIDALFISIGANDVRFSNVVKGCILWLGCSVLGGIKDDFDARIQELPTHYDALAERISQLNVKQVFITEYFDPTRDELGVPNLGCVLGADLAMGVIDPMEASWAAGYILPTLNDQVRQAAEKHGWTYVSGIAEAFRAHGYCADESWIVDIGSSLFEQVDINGAFHPNERGHQEYGAFLERAYVDSGAMGTPPAQGASTGSSTLHVLGTRFDDQLWVTSLEPRSGGGLDVVTARPVTRLLAGAPAVGQFAIAATPQGSWITWTEDPGFGARATGMLEPHVYTAAGALPPPDLELLDAQLVQATEDAGFVVADKATAVQIAVRSTLIGQHVVDADWRVLDGTGAEVASGTTPMILKPGRNVHYVRPGQGLVPTDGEWSVQVRVDPTDQVEEAYEDNNERTTDPWTIRHGRALELLYVPVGGVSCAQVESLMTSSSAQLHALLPVPDGALVQRAVCGIDVPAANRSRTSIENALVWLQKAGLAMGYDIVVGVTPSGWVQAPMEGALGVSLVGGSQPGDAPGGAMLVEAQEGALVLAHEIGHSFGLGHTNDDPVHGYWVHRGVRVDGLDLMRPVKSGKEWVGPGTWGALMDRFQVRPVAGQRGASGSLVIAGDLADDPGGQPWYRSDAEPTVALGSDGDLVLEYLDAAGGSLGTVGLDLQDLGHWGAQAAGDDEHGTGTAFGARVPWVEGTARLVLRTADGAVVVDRPVSASAPKVTVTSPVTSTWVLPGDELVIRWTASDAESAFEDLRATISYSTDGGETFKPLAVDLPGGEHAWTVDPWFVGKPLQIKVEVTDGVRSTAAVSETFQVGGQPPSNGPRLVVVRNELPDGPVERDAPPPHRLYTMDPDGSNVAPFLHELDRSIDAARWSPDGTRLAVSYRRRENDDPDTGVLVVDRDGSNLIRISDPELNLRFVTCVQWHPDGSRLFAVGQAEHGDSRFYWLAADGSGVEEIMNLGTGAMEHHGGTCPVLSPDGTKVTTTMLTNESGYVYVIDLATEEISRIYQPPPGEVVIDAFWSPDGQDIWFHHARDYDHNASVNTIDSIAADGSSEPVVRFGVDAIRNDRDPRLIHDTSRMRFTPDGTRLLLTTPRWGIITSWWVNRAVCTVRPDGSDLQCIWDPEGPRGMDGGGYHEADLSVGDPWTPTLPPAWPDPEPTVEPSEDEGSIGGPYEVLEDQPITLEAVIPTAITKLDANPVVEWDLDGDRDFDDAFGPSPTVTFPDYGGHYIWVRFRAADGTTVEQAGGVQVIQAPPSATGPTSIQTTAGRPTRLEGFSFVDPGTDRHIAVAVWGDGHETSLQIDDHEGGPLRGEHTWAEPGTYDAYIRFCDVDGAACTQHHFTVEVGPAREGSLPEVEDLTVRTAPGELVTFDVPLTVPDDDDPEIVLLDPPASGHLLGFTTGSAMYLPAPDYEGVIELHWYARDPDGDTHIAVVRIIVGNLRPLANNDQVTATAGAARVIEPAELVANDESPDGDELTVHLAYADQDTAGEVTMLEDGRVRFTPADGFTGSTWFHYVATDGTAASQAMVEVLVQPAAEGPGDDGDDDGGQGPGDDGDDDGDQGPGDDRDDLGDQPGGDVDVDADGADRDPPLAPQGPGGPARPTSVGGDHQGRGGPLPRTGSDPLPMLAGGSLLLLLGVALVVADRIRARRVR